MCQCGGSEVRIILAARLRCGVLNQSHTTSMRCWCPAIPKFARETPHNHATSELGHSASAPPRLRDRRARNGRCRAQRRAARHFRFHRLRQRRIGGIRLTAPRPPYRVVPAVADLSQKQVHRTRVITAWPKKFPSRVTYGRFKSSCLRKPPKGDDDDTKTEPLHRQSRSNEAVDRPRKSDSRTMVWSLC